MTHTAFVRTTPCSFERSPLRAICGYHPQRSLLWYMSSPRDSISDELESLVMRFARFAGRIAHDRGLHQEDLDELLQELRVRFWRARKDGLRDLSAGYVRRAAISAALDIIRRRRVDRNVSLEDDRDGRRAARGGRRRTRRAARSARARGASRNRGGWSRAGTSHRRANVSGWVSAGGDRRAASLVGMQRHATCCIAAWRTFVRC